MADVLFGVAALGALLLVPAGLLLLGRRVRRRGLGHSVLAPFEEIWDPVAHRTNIEIEVLAEQEAPAPAPGEPGHGGSRAGARVQPYRVTSSGGPSHRTPEYRPGA